MSKFKAKRICAGEYEYRGHSISLVWSDFGGGEYMWFISKLDGHPGYFDPVYSLRYAKECVDSSLE